MVDSPMGNVNNRGNSLYMVEDYFLDLKIFTRNIFYFLEEIEFFGELLTATMKLHLYMYQ